MSGPTALAVKTNGTLWGWGSQGFGGTIGDGTVTNRSSPVSVVGGFTDWCQVSTGTGTTVGIRTNGTIWAWGCNQHGQLGDNTLVDRSSPVSVVGGFTTWKRVSSSGPRIMGIK
jgi:alpha-tubulin suppressor-like RCC1 family protein